MKRPFLLILNVAVFIGMCVWTYNEPSYEPVIGIIGALAGLVALYVDSDSAAFKIKQKQRGGRNSKNNQAGGDMTISY